MQDLKLQQLFKRFEDMQKEGNLDGQIAVLRQLLSLSQNSGNAVAEIEMLRLLGNAYQDKDQIHRAHSYRVIAAELLKKHDSVCPLEVQMHVYGDLGRSYIEVHDWEKAESPTLRASEIAHSINDEHAYYVYQVNLGLIYTNTEREEKAKELADEVIREGKRLNDNYILTLQHLNLAFVLLEKFHLNESHFHAREAWHYANYITNKSIQGGVLLSLGKIFGRVGLLTYKEEYSKEAQDFLQQVIEVAQSNGIYSLEADTETELAKLNEAQGNMTKAGNHYQRALELMEKVRNSLAYEEFQLTYFRSIQPTFERVIEFHLCQGNPKMAFSTSEQLRSRLLLALLGEGKLNTHSWSQPQRQKLTETLNQYGKEVIQQCSMNAKKSREINFTVGIRSIYDNSETTSDNEFVNEARQKFLHLYESQRLNQLKWQQQQTPQITDIEKLQQILSDDEALLSYMVTDRSVIVFTITDQLFHFQHLNYSREKISTDVEELCSNMSALQDQIFDSLTAAMWFNRSPQDPWPTSIQEIMTKMHRSLEKIYAFLIAPVLAVVDWKQHWIIVPHGPLHRIPWAALRGFDHYLIEKQTLSLLPSASLYAILKNLSHQTLKEAIFFGDPDSDNTRLKLPASQHEVQAGYKALQAGPSPFIGANATKKQFFESAKNARVLHLACHHFFDASTPQLSFMKLAGKNGADFLYAFEITELDLQAELVILSACQSARSRIATGDEQIGIVRAFFAAGAKSIISTLWSIEDQSAANLFTSFYNNASQYNLAQALAIAQRSLIADHRYQLPYFWAPYVLSGSWKASL